MVSSLCLVLLTLEVLSPGVYSSSSLQQNIRTQSQLLHDFLKSVQQTHDVFLVSDWSSSPIDRDEIPATKFDVDGIRGRVDMIHSACPVMIPYKNMSPEDLVIPQDSIYHRKQVIQTSKPLAIIAMVSDLNLPELLNSLEDDVMWCPQRIDMGLLDNYNKFLFLTNQNISTEPFEEILFSRKRFQTHPHVTILESRSTYSVIKRYNRYHLTNGQPGIQSILVKSTSNLPNTFFPQLKNLGGSRLTDLNALFAHFIQADFIPGGGEPNRRLTNHWGLVPDLLQTVGEHINAEIELIHPEPIFDYGGINENGSWTGQVSMLLYDKADFSLELASSFPFRQVLRGLRYGPPEYLSFASPKNLPKSKTFALLHPFGLLLWGLVAVTVVAMPVLLFIFGTGQWNNGNKTRFELFLELCWCCFSILLGEYKISDITIIPYTQRSLLASWLLYCLIMGFAYSSTLKSFLMTPGTEPSIDSLQGIVDSGLRIKMAVYDDVFDNEIEASDDPVRSMLWDLHEPLTEFRGPLKDVETGAAININWRAHLNAMIKVHHSTSDGTPLIHLGEEPILFKTHISFQYTPDKPWGPLIESVIHRIEDSGLFQHWKDKAIRRMRDVQRTSGAKPEAASCSSDEVCALALDHYIGTFYVLAIGAGLAIISLVLELLTRASWHARKTVVLVVD